MSYNNIHRLLKQVEQSKYDSRMEDAPKIRVKSYKDTVYSMVEWDHPHWNFDRTWKRHRKTQWK